MGDVETLKLLGGGGAFVSVCLIVWLLLTRTIPNLAKEFREERKADREEREKDRQMLQNLHLMIHERADQQLEHHQRLIDTLSLIADRINGNGN